MKLIIEHPEWQTPRQRVLLGSVTLIFWMGWFYLWVPVISVLAWVFGYRIFEYQMIVLGGYTGVIELLGWYALSVLLLGGSLIAWATYNILRFNQVTRRNPRFPVTVENQAKYFGVDAKDIALWRKSQLVVIEHDDDSQISRVRVL